jgi:hypothetical protein
VKITKRGTLLAACIWEATCWKCKTEVEAEERELDGVQECQRDGWYAKEKPCPVCLTPMSFHRTDRTATAEPEPRRCQKCGRAENNHDVRHPFVASGGGAQ